MLIHVKEKFADMKKRIKSHYSSELWIKYGVLDKK